MNVLITGGCGFIGSHLAELHLTRGDHVKVIDNLSTGNLDNISAFQNCPEFIFENANLETYCGLEEATLWADRIYHMASVMGVYHVLANPIKVLTSNILACEYILRAMITSGSTARLIVASSSSVYGHSSQSLLNENDNLIINSSRHPLRGYAISKICIEELTLAYYQKFKIPLTVIRLFNTIGPRQTGRYGMVVPRFIQQACLGEHLTVYGDGTQTRSFCDVRDVVSILNLLAENPKSIGEIINVGQDVEITINDLAKMICKNAKTSSHIQYITYKEAYGEEITDISQRRPDLSKLLKHIDFQHQWTLEKTIMDLIQRFV